MNRKQLGRRGEDLALKFLKKNGYRFLDRNFYCPIGEVDLVVQKRNELVFVEVKTRFSSTHGSPEEAVNSRKIQSIAKTAEWFRKYNPQLPEKWRIDVIAIEINEAGEFIDLRHIINITA